MDFGIASVAAITVIAYLVGIGCKAAGAVKDELIPVICGCVGAGLGIAGLYLMPDFPAKDVINALAVGIVEVILVSRQSLPSKGQGTTWLFGCHSPEGFFVRRERS